MLSEQEEQLAALERRIIEAFQVFDHASNKTVDVREIGTIVRSLGCVPSEAEIQDIVSAVEDQEVSGIVQQHVFVPRMTQIIMAYKLKPATAEELLKAFQILDKENKGFIPKEYLQKMMMEFGEPFSKEEIDEMMAIAADPDSGHINYEYYINQILIPPAIYDMVPKKPVKKLGDI